MMVLASASGVLVVSVVIAIVAAAGRENAADYLAITPLFVIIGVAGGVVASAAYWIALS